MGAYPITLYLLLFYEFNDLFILFISNRLKFDQYSHTRIITNEINSMRVNFTINARLDIMFVFSRILCEGLLNFTVKAFKHKNKKIILLIA